MPMLIMTVYTLVVLLVRYDTLTFIRFVTVCAET